MTAVTDGSKALQGLMTIKRRQADRLAIILASQRAELDQLQNEAHAALSACNEAAQREAAASKKRTDMLTTPFVTGAMISLELAIQALKAEVVVASKERDRSQFAVQLQEKVANATQSQIRRIEQRVEEFGRRIAQLRLARDLRIEDTAEEEAEETAAARITSRSRAVCS